VLTDTPRGPTRAAEFVLGGMAWSLGVFGLLRLHWTEAHVVLPLVRAQGHLAVRLFGTSALPVEATLACSGADAMTLCLGAILAYPVPWPKRLAGAAGGLALILALNTVRIGTLGRAVASAAWFNALHLYIWPAVLTLAIAGYVFAWMRVADRMPRPASPPAPARQAPQPSRRFVLFTAAFVMLFSVASPLYLESRWVLALAGFIARAAAATLSLAGLSAQAAGNVLWTPRGAFAVTQECIATPLIPLYLAAVCACSTTWRRLVPGVLATLPLFTALGILRLLVVALPDAVASPLFFVHAFYQLLLGAVIVVVAALWRHGRRAAAGHALAGVIAGVLFVYLLGPLYARVLGAQTGTPIDDPQGAIAFLPSFQAGLYLALWVAAFVAVGWKRFLAGLAALGLTQAACLIALHALAGHPDLTAHVRDVRGWAVAGPVLVFAAVINGARTRR
jgi:exosortase/archaeosortase family protein